jgi:hypothetical protein
VFFRNNGARMDRYNTPLNSIFSRAHKLALEHKVELALLKALGESGLIPAGAHAEAAAAVASGSITLERTLAIEKETHHDIMAVVKAMTEKCPTYGGFIHYGATSQDVNDTVTALQLQACKDALLAATGEVRAQLTRLAERYRELPTIGRTHGQHAIPITMGFKFANYLYEMTVAESFLARVQVVAKFSGAVGTFASLGTSTSTSPPRGVISLSMSPGATPSGTVKCILRSLLPLFAPFFPFLSRFESWPPPAGATTPLRGGATAFGAMGLFAPSMKLSLAPEPFSDFAHSTAERPNLSQITCSAVS